MHCRFGFRRHFAVAPWSPFMEIHWADPCQLYITPVGCEEICVVVISRDPHLRLSDALPLRFPPALCSRAVESVHGNPLGRPMPALYHSSRLRGNLRGGDFARPSPASFRCTAASVSAGTLQSRRGVRSWKSTGPTHASSISLQSAARKSAWW